MLSRAEIKSMARAQIKGNLTVLFICNLIPILASAVGNFVGPAGVFAAQIAQPAFSMGLVMVFLALSYGERPAVGDVFNGFKLFIKSLWVYFLISAFTILWSLLLIVPGIIKGLSYSMAPYILAENPSMDGLDAINESRKLMDGHKMDYFMLGVSFIGWALLMVATAGIAGIYIVSYMQASAANFYNAVKEAKRGELDWITRSADEEDDYQRREARYAYETPARPDESQTRIYTPPARDDESGIADSAVSGFEQADESVSPDDSQRDGIRAFDSLFALCFFITAALIISIGLRNACMKMKKLPSV